MFPLRGSFSASDLQTGHLNVTAGLILYLTHQLPRAWKANRGFVLPLVTLPNTLLLDSLQRGAKQSGLVFEGTSLSTPVGVSSNLIPVAKSGKPENKHTNQPGQLHPA